MAERTSRKIAPALLTLAVVAGGITYLFWSSAGEAFEYYKHVDEVAANPGAWTGKHLQMHGFVQPGERVFVILASGSLSMSQSVTTLLRSEFDAGEGLAKAESLVRVIRDEDLRKVVANAIAASFSSADNDRPFC